MPSVPEGEKLDFGSEHFRELERAGVAAAAGCAFVLVAGGLGERLGYSGIKVALPVESASGQCFLELYLKHILALGVSALCSSLKMRRQSMARLASTAWSLHRANAMLAPCASCACCHSAAISMCVCVRGWVCLGAQAKAGRALPLAIMTSDDTHARTEALLKDNDYWGASANQITLIKQEKVACLSGAHVRRLPHLRLAAASLLLCWLYSGGRQ